MWDYLDFVLKNYVVQLHIYPSTYLPKIIAYRLLNVFPAKGRRHWHFVLFQSTVSLWNTTLCENRFLQQWHNLCLCCTFHISCKVVWYSPAGSPYSPHFPYTFDIKAGLHILQSERVGAWCTARSLTVLPWILSVVKVSKISRLGLNIFVSKNMRTILIYQTLTKIIK